MFDKILEDREKRYNEILYLLEKYKLPVLCGKINYPGNNKNTEEVQKAFELLRKLLKNNFGSTAKHTEINKGLDGPYFSMVLSMDGRKAKKLAVKIEDENALGRIFDIDIYIDEGRPIGRAEIGLQPRKCIICGGDARSCSREKTHGLSEVLDKINNMINKHGEKND